MANKSSFFEGASTPQDMTDVADIKLQMEALLAEAEVKAEETNGYLTAVLATASGITDTVQSASQTAQEAINEATVLSEVVSTVATNALEASASASSAEASASASNASEIASASSEIASASSENASSLSATNASASESKANLWAEQAEDLEVELGSYSAKHHALKASSSATQALASQNASATSESNASASESSASASATSASTSAATATSGASIATTQANLAFTAKTASETASGIATTQAGIATTKASEASASATAAQASLDEFQGQYHGSSATAPMVGLDVGDLYFDTVLNEMRVYDGTVWKSAGSTVNGTSVRQSYTATAGQTVFTVTGGYDAGFADVYLNGVKLVNGVDVDVSSGTAVVLTVGATAGNNVDVIAYGAFEVANTYTQAEIDAKDALQTTALETYSDNNSIGVNQTWQDVSASRSAGVTYTNTTGKPIVVSCGYPYSVGAYNRYLLVDGHKVAETANGYTAGNAFRLGAVVPNGSTYLANDVMALWHELR